MSGSFILFKVVDDLQSISRSVATLVMYTDQQVDRQKNEGKSAQD